MIGATASRRVCGLEVTRSPPQHNPSPPVPAPAERSTLNTHSTLNTRHSTPDTQHSTLNTQHSTLNTGAAVLGAASAEPAQRPRVAQARPHLRGAGRAREGPLPSPEKSQKLRCGSPSTCGEIIGSCTCSGGFNLRLTTVMSSVGLAPRVAQARPHLRGAGRAGEGPAPPWFFFRLSGLTFSTPSLPNTKPETPSPKP